MAELLKIIPPEVVIWLLPIAFIVLILFFEQRNTMLANSIEKLDKTVEKLSELIDRQDKTLDEVTQRLVRVEVELEGLKYKGREKHAQD